MSNVLKFTTRSIYQLPELFDKVKSHDDISAEFALKGLLKALDTRDNYTFNHSKRVCYYSLLLGLEEGMSDRELYELQIAALFHDIGKIGVPDAVLNKPTRLTEIEFRMMQKHPLKSFEILSEFETLESVASFALHHHERYDGRGYPDSLKETKIPLASRIIFIADTFDSMTSDRVYRNAFPQDIAFNELIEFAGSQFDPGLVDKFVDLMRNHEGEHDFFVPLLEPIKKLGKAAA